MCKYTFNETNHWNFHWRLFTLPLYLYYSLFRNLYLNYKTFIEYHRDLSNLSGSVCICLQIYRGIHSMSVPWMLTSGTAIYCLPSWIENKAAAAALFEATLNTKQRIWNIRPLLTKATALFLWVIMEHALKIYVKI